MLLLVHDLTVYSSAYEWNKVIDELAENSYGICIDLLGCGRSEKPKNHIYKLFICTADIRLYQKCHCMKKQILLPADFQVLLLYLHATMRHELWTLAH